MWKLVPRLFPLFAAIGTAVSINTVNAQIPPRLVVYPPHVSLTSKRDCRQLVVTVYENGVSRDVTHSAHIQVADPRIAVVAEGVVRAVSNGDTMLMVASGSARSIVPIHIANSQRPDPIRFKFETLPVLTRQGCSTGSCHGAPHGKGGFALSLFGYSPAADRVALTRDGFNRRINVMDPSDSLMIKKPMLQLPHVGGRRLHRSEEAYGVLLRWISEGANTNMPEIECTGIKLYPVQECVLGPTNTTQQLSVLASYSDGSVRDVTQLSAISSSSQDVATAGPRGNVTAHARGQAAITVRYLDKVESVHFTVIETVKGFKWNQPTAASEIDRLVEAKLKQLQYLPSPICSDAVFLRRVYLDITGLLPTADQARAFLQDTSSTKRGQLIDRLLETEEYARFWASKRAELMRVTPDRLKDDRAARFSEWIVDSVRSNTPYDRFARELITASGDTKKSPAACYYVAIPTMQERTEMTAQIFMGSRVECARCHNHPFENWTMRDYYSIGAVFARTTATDKGMVTLAAAGEAVNPVTGERMAPYGSPSSGSAGTDDRREYFAAWLTNAGNPLFARVAVNRIWAALMGRGIVEPVDDFRSSNPASNQPLLDYLAESFIKSEFDCKAAIRRICNSKTYQRSSEANVANGAEDTLFSHVRARMLTAEQVKDAIGMTTHSLPVIGEAGARSRYATEAAFPTNSAFMAAFGQPERSSACACERQTAPTLIQALELLNGPTAHAMAQEASAYYGPLDDSRIVEEFYLSGLSRYPTANEKAVALAFLKRSAHRPAAITDLAWTIVNLREFLFQH